ncbi:ABC transporter ATP-binding protein [Ilumatobacter nonamiensis]|uniref:ABC transporter ATP-binding protein n=1 Tax=Ilumatobacter nonamiensis TaxID=467093 RepID=UPI000349946A|nr:ABC transporter ATP-binding protein [Ilumatobacter nonamiensis]
MTVPTELLQCEGVGRRFGSVTAVDDVTLGVRSGEVLGLIGPNGAGKTTLVNLMSAYLSPTSGEIKFAGESIAGCKPHELARRGIARTYQNVCLFEQSTVLDNVLTGRHLGFQGGLWQLGRKRHREEARERQLAVELIELLGLAEHMNEDVSAMSYGLRRRVEIARALAIEPQLLLLDEPTAGMTRTESDEVGRLIGELRAGGMTVLLIDHNVRLVSETCDRVAVLDWGRVIAIDEPAEVWADERVREAYLGTGESG